MQQALLHEVVYVETLCKSFHRRPWLSDLWPTYQDVPVPISKHTIPCLLVFAVAFAVVATASFLMASAFEKV